MSRLGRPPYICLVTEGKSDPHNFEHERQRILDTLRDAVMDGVNVIQIREKSLPARLLFELASAAVAICRPAGAIVLVNDRADVALAAGADGVHLPEASIPAAIFRQSFPTDLVVGVSTHSVEGALATERDGADYIFFGPVFTTPGKQEPAGLGELGNVCERLRTLPVVGIGGIDETNAANVLGTGAAGIAAIRALNDAASRRKLIDALDDLHLG